jgi:hypothetical protein
MELIESIKSEILSSKDSRNHTRLGKDKLVNQLGKRFEDQDLVGIAFLALCFFIARRDKCK